MWRFGLLVLLLLQMAPTLAAEPRPFVAGSLDAILVERAGHPFALVFWSVDCVPCIAEMKFWLAFRGDNPEVGVILVSTDRPDDVPRIQHILEKLGMENADSWVFADRRSARLRYGVDPSWRGELPRVYLFDRGGRISATIAGEPASTDLEAWLSAEKGRP